jgi:cob(I)alamin adenosyltransferase
MMNVAEKPFNEPQLALNRIYTRTGDRGQTALAGGQRVQKDALRIETYGTVDELNSQLGMACFSAESDSRLASLASSLKRVQHELFNLGSILATLPEDVHPKQPRITPAEIELLEHEIDEANGLLPGLRSFVLPGGSRINTELHLARTVCRRAERLVVRLSREEPVPDEAVFYLNRLSDTLFVWSRWANHLLEAPEVLWSPNEAASARPKVPE